MENKGKGEEGGRKEEGGGKRQVEEGDRIEVWNGISSTRWKINNLIKLYSSQQEMALRDISLHKLGRKKY